MKAVLLSFIFAIVIVAVSVHAYQDQSRIIGTVRLGDKLLDQAYAIKAPIRGRNTEYNYKYPKWWFWGKQISCIKVMDLWFNGTNGDLYLNSGGVGSKTVNMKIQSKIGYGIQYNIEIWGR